MPSFIEEQQRTHTTTIETNSAQNTQLAQQQGSSSPNVAVYVQFLAQSVTSKASLDRASEELHLLTNAGSLALQATTFTALLQATVQIQTERKSRNENKLHLLHTYIDKTLLTRANFISIICQCKALNQKEASQFSDFVRAYSLNLTQSIGIALALSQSNSNLGVSESAAEYLVNKLSDSEFCEVVLRELREKYPFALQSLAEFSRTFKALEESDIKAPIERAAKAIYFKETQQTTSTGKKLILSQPLTMNINNKAKSLQDITNFLGDIGPLCSKNVNILRETIREASNGATLREDAVSNLIVFFMSKFGSGIVGGSTEDELSASLISNIVGDSTSSHESKQAGNINGWSIEVISHMLREDYSNLDWKEVARQFGDIPSFHVQNKTQVAALLHLFKAGSGGYNPPQYILFQTWTYSEGQLSLFHNLVDTTADIYMFQCTDDEVGDAKVGNGSCSNQCWACADFLHRLLVLSDVPQYHRAVRDIFARGLRTCPEVLLCSLIRLQINSGQAAASTGRALKSELMGELVTRFFKPSGHPINAPALKRLWQISQNTLAGACSEAWRGISKNAGVGERLAVANHVVGILRLIPEPTKVLAMNDFEFCIAVAFCAADKEIHKLHTWVLQRISSAGAPFLIALIQYVAIFYKTAAPRVENVLVSFENVATCLKIMPTCSPEVLNQPGILVPNTLNDKTTLGDSIKALTDAIVNEFPQVINYADVEIQSPNDEIEEIANSYFQKIYTSEQSIAEVIDMLKRFKSSGSARENDIFACMITNLFDEYRFFSKYPEKELRITGILFGQLIQHQLVSSITLGIALRYVLEALRKSPGPGLASGGGSNGKMFRFGMFALEQFKTRLHEWPQYCSHIVQIPHLKEHYAELVGEIAADKKVEDQQQHQQQQQQQMSGHHVAPNMNAALSNPPVMALPPPALPAGMHDHSGVLPPAPPLQQQQQQQHQQQVFVVAPKPVIPRVAVFGPGLGRAVNGTTSADEEHTAPPDTLMDRITLLINNLSPSNCESKATEMQSTLPQHYFQWLGHYLVLKRISTQPNFHNLYLHFIDYLGEWGRGLVEAIIGSVYLNIGKLLRSSKITTSTSERSLLKNLGSWLGSITLARNRPILQVQLDCKELLFQGYETGMLIAVTPFVAKILEGAKNSPVFRPPNPWVMGLLSVFHALYNIEDLKMNIKFEVEVLCKNLGVKLEEIEIRDDALNRRIPPNKNKNPDFNLKASAQAAAAAATPTPTPPLEPKQPHSRPGSAGPPMDNVGNPVVSGGLPPMAASDVSVDGTAIPNLAAYVVVPPSLTGYGLKRIVPIALDRAIREIIQPVIERSVTIACITTKELVTKDFAMEGSEAKMRKAAQLMVANLAGSLALVTCREPLRTSLSTHMRQLLTAEQPQQQQQQQEIELCVQTSVTDNLELGCMLIEKAATEKAVRDIEETLAPAYNVRKQHLADTGQLYHDMSIFNNNNNNSNNNSRYPAALPELLRPKPAGGLQSHELLVYDAFARRSSAANLAAFQAQNAANDKAAAAARAAAAAVPTSLNANRSAGGGVNVNMSVDNSPAVGAAATNNTVTNNVVAAETMNALLTVTAKLDQTITATLQQLPAHQHSNVTLGVLPNDHAVHKLLMGIRRAVAGMDVASQQQNVLGFCQSVFKRLYESSLVNNNNNNGGGDEDTNGTGSNIIPLRLEALVAVLEAVYGQISSLKTNLNTWITFAPTETPSQRLVHRTVLLLLLRSKLISPTAVDGYIGTKFGGEGSMEVEFAGFVLKTAVLERIAAKSEFPNVVRNMQALAMTNTHVRALLDDLSIGMASNNVNNAGGATMNGASVPPLVSQLNNNLTSATYKAMQSTKVIASNDPPSSRQQVTFLLENWLRVYAEGVTSPKTLQYLQLLQQHGIGKNEDQTERFFRYSVELVTEAVLKSNKDGTNNNANTNSKTLSYHVVDVYAKLVVLLVHHMNGGGSAEQVANQRVHLLNKILGITVRTLMTSYEKVKNVTSGNVNVAVHWDQRPWFRLLLNLIQDLGAPSVQMDPIRASVLSVFGSALHVVQPCVVPGFAFAWLELVSHRMFLSNLMLLKDRKGWALAHQLFIDLFLFLEPHLRTAEMTDAIKHLYNGAMRVLLVLVHDFPSFLADYHLSFCNVIPENCIQLRNLILSASPRGMVMPDPFTPNLKIDHLPEISSSPVVLSNVTGPILALRPELDGYLKTRQPVNFLQNLLPRLCKEGTNDVDTPRVNSLVLYVGIQAIARLQHGFQHLQIAQTPEMEVLQKLMDFDDRGRYISLNAIANQLRYPSSHSHYFSCVMLFLFSEAKDDGVKEQVTRVLLERLISHRPHPWALIITFVELLKNQRYQFWSHSFTRCATEIEKVFESVARSCMSPPSSQRVVTAGGEEIS